MEVCLIWRWSSQLPFIVIIIYGVVCVQLAHFSLGDWKDMSIAHVIIIIKSEVSILPIVIIFFRGCVPKMFAKSYSVGICSFILGKICYKASGESKDLPALIECILFGQCYFFRESAVTAQYRNVFMLLVSGNSKNIFFIVCMYWLFKAVWTSMHAGRLVMSGQQYIELVY